MAENPIDLFFGGTEKLGPGSNADTLHVLRLLPRQQFGVIVDAGCGTGRQTLALASTLGTPVRAVDRYQPFLDELTRRAEAAGVGQLIQPHCMDMAEIPAVFPQIDLLWSEGAAYNIGFGHALKTWVPAITPAGFAVVSELCWLGNEVPAEVSNFFAAAYPDMKPVEQNIALAEAAGFRLLATDTLPRDAWITGYYDIQEQRARALSDHADAAVRDLAREMLKEIDAFRMPGESYGYVFFVLQPR